MARLVDRGMDHITCLINRIWAVIELVALQINLHQVRRRDLIIREAKRIDQDLFGIWDTGRNVVVNLARPTVVVHQPVTRCQIDPCLPFGLAHTTRGT